MREKMLITVCGRAGSKGFRNKNLKTFCSKPLVHYTLSAATLFMQMHPEMEIDIVVNTDSGLLRELVQSAYPQVYSLPRPAALAGDTTAKMQVFQHSLHAMEEKRASKYNYLLDLDITSPLRSAQDIDGCFMALKAREELQLVMSACKSRRSPYMNMARRENGFAKQVIPTGFTARQQAPQCYDLNASIYVFRRQFLAENETGFIWDAACDVYEMEDSAVLDIDSEEDYVLMEIIAKHLYATRPLLAKVRSNIP